MKIKLQILLTFCALSLSIKSQHWFPENANWIFNNQELLSVPAHGYTIYTVAEDTLINDTIAKLITIDNYEYDGITSIKKPLFVHESNSRVYLWNGTQFKLMYDFNLNVGDTLDVGVNIFNCDSVSPIIVDSISYLNINGDELKIQHTSYTLYAETQYGFNTKINDQIIERIGSEVNFIYSPNCIIHDEPAYSGLRCYEDNSILHKNEWWENLFPEIACDSLIYNTTLNIQELEQSEFHIFPNPANDFVTITNKNSNADNFYIELYNSSGKQLNRILVGKTATINISNYPSGLYFIKIYQTSTEFYTYKLIKCTNR